MTRKLTRCVDSRMNSSQEFLSAPGEKSHLHRLWKKENISAQLFQHNSSNIFLSAGARSRPLHALHPPRYPCQEFAWFDIQSLLIPMPIYGSNALATGPLSYVATACMSTQEHSRTDTYALLHVSNPCVDRQLRRLQTRPGMYKQRTTKLFYFEHPHPTR